MSEEELREIRERCEKAAAGPWYRPRSDVPRLLAEIEVAAQRVRHALEDYLALDLSACDEVIAAALAAPVGPQEEPTDCDEPPWQNWFSCEDCGGWFYRSSPESSAVYESGVELCLSCAKIYDAKVAVASPPSEGREG